MASERYVVLGLARVRSPWFARVAQWAGTGALAVDFVKTVSADEVRARLASGRLFSALLVDGGLPGVDRDLLTTAAEHGCAPIVVTDGRGRDWSALGAAGALAADFGRTELDSALTDWAQPISGVDDVPGRSIPATDAGGYRGRVVAVTGTGGTGASVVAMALARAAAADVDRAHNVVLADLCRHADLAVLHDARDVTPGLLELVEAHRAGAPSVDEVLRLTFDVTHGQYRLLLGLRRHRDWTAVRPRALEAALDGLRRSCRLVVADIEADIEGEDATGSADVEDRNRLARTTVALADVIVVVIGPGPKGVHSGLRVVRELLRFGVDADRIVTVVNRAPRRGSARAEIAVALSELLAASHPGIELLSPVFLAERRGLDERVRDGLPMPSALGEPVLAAVDGRLRALPDRAPLAADDEPVPVAVGSLGSWADDGDDGDDPLVARSGDGWR